MRLIKNLLKVPLEEQKIFIRSFDYVLSDMDGVIWSSHQAFPGAAESIDTLKNIGKKVSYVTNNGGIHVKKLWQMLRKNNFNAALDDIVSPMLPAISHLNHLNFKKDIFLIGSNDYREALVESGFVVAPEPWKHIESIQELLENIEDNEKIGAVIAEIELNTTSLKLQKALTYLKRKDCLFITGASNSTVSIGPLGPAIGSRYFQKILEEFSGRQPFQVGKPSSNCLKYVIEKYRITDPKRVLFIGDTIDIDMVFATKGNFKKLLVLTGDTDIKHVLNWKFPEDHKPDYYVESIGDLETILNATR